MTTGCPRVVDVGMRISELFKKAELMGLSNLQEEAEGVEMALRFLAGVTGPSWDRKGK